VAAASITTTVFEEGPLVEVASSWEVHLEEEGDCLVEEVNEERDQEEVEEGLLQAKDLLE